MPGRDDDIIDIKRGDVKVPGITCQRCCFYKRMAVYKLPCFQLGTAPSAKPCARFVPDPAQMDKLGRLAQTLRLVGEVKSPNMIIMALLAAPKIKRLGFRAGQIVYHRPHGKDFLDNYCKCLIVGATTSQLVLIGPHNFSALVFPKSVLNIEEFTKKRESLLKRGLTHDPDKMTYVKPPVKRRKARTNNTSTRRLTAAR